jgi:hypothetical protein
MSRGLNSLQSPPIRDLQTRTKRILPVTSVPSAKAVISDSEQDSDARSVASSDKVIVTHEYQDYSYEREDSDDEANQQKRRGPRGGVAHPFPEKLHLMLGAVEEEGLEHIVSWLPHGRSFMVHKPKEFVAEIMPNYFKQTKLTSFQRQLNLYGFQRITTGSERGSYFHPLFLRHRFFLCERMMRTRIKGTGTKGAINPEAEPDFNSMPPIKPLDQTPLNKPDDEKTAWKVKYTQSMKKHRQDKEKAPKPTLKHHRVSTCDDPMTAPTSTTPQRFAPPVVPSAEHFISEKAQPSTISSKKDDEEFALSLSRPPSYPKILPLVMPVLPRSCPSTVTPPQTPVLDEALPPPVPEMPDDWLLSDTGPLDEPISFEGKTFHYLDACSFDCLAEDGGNDQSTRGFSLKDTDEFFAGLW